MQLSIKVVKSDKDEMLEEYVKLKDASTSGTTVNGDADGDSTSTVLPHDRFVSESVDSANWIKYDKPILYI